MIEKMKLRIFCLLIFVNLVSCANNSKQQRTFSSIDSKSCTEIVGQIGLRIREIEEIEFKKSSLIKIKEKYPYFSDEQASKHFDLLKSSCL